MKKKSIFSWKLSSKMLVLKKVKSHSGKKKMENFYQQKKYVKKQLLLVFFDSLSKTDTQTALNDSTTIIN